MAALLPFVLDLAGPVALLAAMLLVSPRRPRLRIH